MSISIPPSGVGSAGSIGPASAPAAERAVSAAVNTLVTRIATTVTGQLGLTPQRSPLHHDPYNIRETAAALSSAVNASPGQSGEIERALTLFVQSAAARIGAQPNSASVNALANAANTLRGASADSLITSLIGAAQHIA